MKIVIALDSFKGSCSAQAACAAVAPVSYTHLTLPTKLEV